MAPMMKGHSPQVVSSNIREMMKAGHSRNQAVASSLASSRKYKKMADGGMVEQEDPEDYNRSLGEIQEEGRSYPNEVANPMEQEESSSFAKALRHKVEMDMGPESENYAMGGLVEPEHDPDMGNKPDEDFVADTSEPMSLMPGKGESLEHPKMEDPSGMGLSKEALDAIRRKKMGRRFVP